MKDYEVLVPKKLIDNIKKLLENNNISHQLDNLDTRTIDNEKLEFISELLYLFSNFEEFSKLDYSNYIDIEYDNKEHFERTVKELMQTTYDKHKNNYPSGTLKNEIIIKNINEIATELKKIYKNIPISGTALNSFARSGETTKKKVKREIKIENLLYSFPAKQTALLFYIANMIRESRAEKHNKKDFKDYNDTYKDTTIYTLKDIYKYMHPEKYIKGKRKPSKREYQNLFLDLYSISLKLVFILFYDKQRKENVNNYSSLLTIYTTIKELPAITDTSDNEEPTLKQIKDNLKDIVGSEKIIINGKTEIEISIQRILLKYDFTIKKSIMDKYFQNDNSTRIRLFLYLLSVQNKRKVKISTLKEYVFFEMTLDSYKKNKDRFTAEFEKYLAEITADLQIKITIENDFYIIDKTRKTHTE